MTRNGREENRGVVIRAEGGYCYALARDGRYVKVKVEGRMPEAGEIVELPEGTVAPNPYSAGRLLGKAVATYALAALVILAIGTSVAAVALYMQPAACVAIEINPAIELGLNRVGLVVTARGRNPDGEAVAESARGAVMYHPAPDAVAAVVKAAADLGYLRTDMDNVVQVSVVASEAYPHVEQGIREKVAALLEKHGFFGYLKVRRAGTAVLDSARADGLSINAYLLKKELEARGIQMSGWGRSVGEILGRIGPENAFGQDDQVGRHGNRGATSDDHPAQGGSDGRGNPERQNDRGRDVERPNRNGSAENPGRGPSRDGEGGVTRGSPGGSESGDSTRAGEADGSGSEGRPGEGADTTQERDDAGPQPTLPITDEHSKAGGAAREPATKSNDRKRR